MVARWREEWNRFFYQPQSPAPLAVYRILLGCLLLANGLLLAPDLYTILGERGMMSAATLHAYSGTRFNLLLVLPQQNGWLLGVFVLYLAAALLLTVGLWSRASAALVFITLASMQQRNPLVLHSGDTFLRVVSFLFIFAPIGAMYSVDHWLATRRGVAVASKPCLSPWAQRLIQYQFTLVYLAGVMWKLQGHTWVDGTALYYTSRLEEFWRFPVPYLYQHMWSIKLLTWYALFVEFALATAIWVADFRYYVITMGILLHLGIEYSMNIPIFELTMIATLVTFVDPPHVEKAVEWLSGRLPGALAVTKIGGHPQGCGNE